MKSLKSVPSIAYKDLTLFDGGHLCLRTVAQACFGPFSSVEIGEKGHLAEGSYDVP